MQEINTYLIINYIEKHNLTKTQFCQNCNISLYLLNKILKGEKIIKITPFIKIVLYMKITLKDLINF